MLLKLILKRWMFKHPRPEDFFRTMEDASAVDLDWFWRGWFYTTDYVDIWNKVRLSSISVSPNGPGIRDERNDEGEMVWQKIS